MDLFERFSTPREYRLASAVLIAGCLLPLGILVGVPASRSWTGAAFVVSLLLYFALFALTYFRLQDASMSNWWLLPMIIVVPFGPRWELASWASSSIVFAPSGILPLVPVAVGWFARTAAHPGA